MGSAVEPLVTPPASEKVLGTVLRRLRRRGSEKAVSRKSETTIKIKFALFRGGGKGGREENCPKRYFSWETS